MSEFDAGAEDEIVLADGTVLVRVWHGAKVSALTGVKGGLMAYPAREREPDHASEDRVPAPRPSVLRVVCPVCGDEKDLPGWQARRFKTCSRTCAMQARHRSKTESAD